MRVQCSHKNSHHDPYIKSIWITPPWSQRLISHFSILVFLHRDSVMCREEGNLRISDYSKLHILKKSFFLKHLVGVWGLTSKTPKGLIWQIISVCLQAWANLHLWTGHLALKVRSVQSPSFSLCGENRAICMRAAEDLNTEVEFNADWLTSMATLSMPWWVF